MRSVLRSIIVHFLTLVLATQVAGAGVRQDKKTAQMKFGPEWEFSNKKVRRSVDGKKIYDAQSAFVNELKILCDTRKDCTVNDDLKSPEYGKVTYHEDGWWFHVIVDLGTVEVIAKPTTLKKFESLKNRIDQDIFKTAASLGLETNSSTFGAGHIHIDKETSGLGSDPTLFRNFIVDFFNHDEIASGILEDDEDNAIAVSKLSESAKDSIRGAIAQFDSSSKDQENLNSMIVAINKSYMKNKTPPKEGEAKFQALNLLHQTTVEIRSLRMQRDMGDFLKVIRLFQSRIDYLKTLKDQLIPLERLKEKQDIGNRLSRFRLYVSESKLKWSDYKDLLNEEHLQALKDLQTEECLLNQLPK